MLFIGPRRAVRTPARGFFYCPRCGAPRRYLHRRIRRFFTFLSLPVFPLSGGFEYVQCGFCRRAFDPGVLGYEPPASEEDEQARQRNEEELAGDAAARLLFQDPDAEF